MIILLFFEIFRRLAIQYPATAITIERDVFRIMLIRVTEISQIFNVAKLVKPYVVYVIIPKRVPRKIVFSIDYVPYPKRTADTIVAIVKSM